MSSVQKKDLISVQDYLAGEEESEVKHEYVAGVLYAMVGGTNRHNMLSSNVLRSLGNQLEGSTCREFNSDTKVRIRTSLGFRFYYPDVQVVCQPNPQSDRFQDSPVLIVEILSDSTRRIDEGEKKDYYLGIPSLQTYVLLEQDGRRAVVFQRTETGFTRSQYDEPDAVINFPELAIHIAFDDVYRDIQF